MKVEIVDDFLSSYYADRLVDALSGIKVGEGMFPWTFTNGLNGKNYPGNFYFTQVLISNSKRYPNEFIELFYPILNQLQVPLDDVWRLKANLYPFTHRRVHHLPHTDYEPDQGITTALYYVNTNNGVTIFDGKKTIKSKKNRVALFDGSNKHHSTTATDCNYRCTINIDYRKGVGRYPGT